jgi:enterochelin esterase family protein
VAWERPDQFSKVLSWVGSFVNLQGGPTGIGGGHNYPVLIRKSKDKPKPIRVFLQDGANDLDNPFGNWPLANQGMAKALAYSGYDFKFVFGQGFHSGKHGEALLPESLRWLWRK